jgi:uncharacterized protein YjiS (DUF1127 family)
MAVKYSLIVSVEIIDFIYDPARRISRQWRSAAAIFGDALMITKQAQSAAAFNGYLNQNNGFAAKSPSLVSRALQRLSKKAQDQQAIWELEQLDDHALRDIGISRFEIEAQVRGLK